MRIAIRIPGRPLEVGHVVNSEASVDAFLTKFAGADVIPMVIRKVAPNASLQVRDRLNRVVLVTVDKLFELEPSGFPFDIYWPQAVLHQCGIPTFQEA